MCDCVFCKIIKREIPSIKLYEDDDCIVILDRFPSSVGHGLVISKNHYRNIFDIDENSYAKLMKIANRYAKIIAQVTKCEGVNILQNSGEVAGQSVYHIHIHIIPRYSKDDVIIHWNMSDVQLEELEDFKLRIEENYVNC